MSSGAARREGLRRTLASNGANGIRGQKGRGEQHAALAFVPAGLDGNFAPVRSQRRAPGRGRSLR